MSIMLRTAFSAARQAGELLRENFGKAHKVEMTAAHDIKLELDLRAQKLIESAILKRFPSHSILGEEGVRGDADSEYRWVIDPLDGTVNYTYSVPHFCVSIACQRRVKTAKTKVSGFNITPGWVTVAGAIYDPMRQELFTASEKSTARMNGQLIHVSPRTKLREAVVSIGFFKTPALINKSMPHFQRLVHRARKVRIMGSAALDLAYVACGRYDAYLEYGIKLWDVAAGLLILEKAGGLCELKPSRNAHTFDIFATGKINRPEVVRTFFNDK